MREKCVNCGLPHHYTGIQFDEKGICNYCNFYLENRAVLENTETLEKIFREKMEDAKVCAKENGARYDCLVGFSGGKDSTYIIQQLTEKYGMRVLAFTFQNAFATEYGRKNIENALQKINVDHISFSMNDKELRRRYTASVNLMHNFCAACFHYMHYYSYLFAGQNKIPIIVNGRTKGQMLQNAVDKRLLEPFETPHSFLEFEHQMFHGLEEKYWKQKKLDYLDDIKVDAISYFAYHDVSEEETMRTLEESIGWTRSKKGHEDCFAHSMAEYMNIQKHSFPIRTGELAVEVRRGKLTVAEMDRILTEDSAHYSAIADEEKQQFESRIR